MKLKIKFILYTYITLLMIPCTKAQNWPKIYGNYFNAYSMRIYEDYDKGYLIGGDVLANFNTFRYAWIIKTDINGNELWNKKYGNGTDQNYLHSCAKTTDQGLIACGNTTIEDYQFDPLFFKLNTCGEVEWCKILLSDGYNGATDIIAVEDGYVGMLLHFGNDTLFSNISLVKMNLEGEPIWIQRLAQEDTLIRNEEGLYLYRTNDSMYLVSGYAYHPGKHPFWILTDTLGNQVWNLFWNSLVGQAHQVVEKDTGIFFSTCWGIAQDKPQSPVLLKFDSDGNPIDNYFLMGDTIGGGSASPIAVLNDTSFIIGIAWKTNTFPDPQGYSEVFLTDTLGNVYNRRLLLNDFKLAKKITKTSDNKILITGNFAIGNNWDIYLWKMNENLEDDTLYTQSLTYDSLCPYEILSDTVDLDCGIFVNIDEIPTKEEYETTIKISPNPARNWVVLTLPDVLASGKVEVMVYDVFGRESGPPDRMTPVVRAGKQGSGDVGPANRMVSLDVSGFSPGMYIAVVVDRKGKRYVGKFVVAK